MVRFMHLLLFPDKVCDTERFMQIILNYRVHHHTGFL
jgi:hypothetical protein